MRRLTLRWLPFVLACALLVSVAAPPVTVEVSSWREAAALVIEQERPAEAAEQAIEHAAPAAPSPRAGDRRCDAPRFVRRLYIQYRALLC